VVGEVFLGIFEILDFTIKTYNIITFDFQTRGELAEVAELVDALDSGSSGEQSL
jgi:hypothetical protein